MINIHSFCSRCQEVGIRSLVPRGNFFPLCKWYEYKFENKRNHFHTIFPRFDLLNYCFTILPAASDAEISKQAIGVGMLVYHSILTFASAFRFPSPIFLAGIIHATFAVAFFVWLNRVGGLPLGLSF